MKVKNHSRPHKTQMEGFFEGDTETPIAMLNLLKFKEKAEYEDGRETCLLYTSPSPRDLSTSRMPSSA